MIAPCHPNRFVKARNLCGSCYDRWLKQVNPYYRTSQLSNTTKWKQRNPEKNRILVERRKLKEANDPTTRLKKKNRELRRKYGITLEQYEELWTRQDGKCAICFRAQGKIALHVDHSHINGVVRGLLCHQCNWYIGVIEKSPGILSRITLYLKDNLWKPSK